MDFSVLRMGILKLLIPVLASGLLASPSALGASDLDEGR